MPTSGPPARIKLADLLPAPEAGLGFGLTPDMLDFLLHEHDLFSLPQRLPPLPDLEECSVEGWRRLPTWDRSTRIQALYLFTDGSFFSGSVVAGWAVVVLGLSENQVVRIGFCHGTCHGTSAYTGELRALAHARAIALSARPIPTVVASDCLSALQVAFGQASFGHTDDTARALAGLALASTAFGQAVAPLHVRSHVGCAFNGLADALAKGAARFVAPAPFEGEVFWTGVAERVCDWVWLLAPNFTSSRQLPVLSETGAWSKAACEAAPSTLASPCLFQPAPTSTTQPAKVSFRAVQYNCLSLRGAPAQALMVSGLQACKVQVTMFQETRLGQTGVGANDVFWTLSSPCLPSGVGGCQIWLHKKAGVVTGAERQWCWNRRSFTIVHASAQLLVVTAAAGPLNFCLVSGHAPFATASEARRQEWWALLSSQLRRIPRGHILILGLDANARFRYMTGERNSAVFSPPVCNNAPELTAVVKEFDLASNAPTSVTGRSIRTWTSPAGNDGAIDYLLVSAAWAEAVCTEDTPDLRDQHQGFDHWPLAVTICASTTGAFPAKQAVFSRKALDTDIGRQVAAEAIATMPSVALDTDVTTHVHVLHQHVRDALVRRLPHMPTPARHPAVTATTLDLVKQHRHLRQVLRCASRLARGARLQALFQAWRLGRANADVCRQARRTSDRLLELCAQHAGASKLVRIAMQQGKANFSREQIAAARSAGPARFAYLLRAITRQGRKFKPPTLLPVLRHEGTEYIGAEAITKTLGASYAAAERASPITPDDFVSSSNDVRSLSDCLDAATSPSVVDLLRGFLDLKKGRAPGLSQLPAEVFAANPIAAALAYAPVVLKLIARGVGPLQWSGGLAHSIPKGTKDPSSVQGWRAILLLESDAKAFQKAWRPYLLQSLDPVRSVGQHGGIPCHTLEQPSALVRAHFQGLSAANQSGGALFVDCAAAYYSVVRDFYLAGPHHAWTDAELQQRAKLFFADAQSQAAFLRDMRDGLWLESLQLPLALHRIVLAQFHRTWYVDGRPGTTLYLTQTGTAPGSPVADALFAFLFSRFLHGMEEFLRGHLASPHIQVQQAEAAEAPAWADDVVILFTARTVSEVEGLLQEIGRQVIKHLRRLGLSANLGPGKTEAVVALRGHGSRDVRRRLLSADCPSLSLTTETEEFPDLRLVPGYTHLGTFLNAELSEMANLKRRAGLLATTFKPIRNRLFNNPFLLPAEKRELLLGRVIPCFLHGSGLWRLSTNMRQLWGHFTQFSANVSAPLLEAAQPK